MKVNGINTIMGLTGEPPAIIEIPKDMMVEAQSLLQWWNEYYMAFIPYCYKCRLPLTWYIDEGQNAFECENCGRIWIRKDS